MPALTNEVLAKLKESLLAQMENKDYFNAAQFTQLCRDAGIDDYKKYVDEKKPSAVAAFVEKYLPDFIVCTKVTINGKTHSALIVPKGRELKFSGCSVAPEPRKPVLAAADVQKKIDEEKTALGRKGSSIERIQPSGKDCKSNQKTMNEWYEAGEYHKVLLCPIFSEIPGLLEKKSLLVALNCAERLLWPNSEKNISLNNFQSALFLREELNKLGWKANERFKQEILDQCERTSCYAEEQEPKLFTKLINDILGKKNSSYALLCERFVGCRNQLTPHVYLLRAFALKNSHDSVEKLLAEICALSKKMITTREGDIAREWFLSIVPAIVVHVLGEDAQLSHGVRMSLFLTSLTLGAQEELYAALPELSADESAPDYQLEQLLVDMKHWNSEEFTQRWTEENFVRIIHVLKGEKFGTSPLYTVLALCWDKWGVASIAKMLAWLIRHESHNSAHEVLDYTFVGGLNWSEKSDALLDFVDESFLKKKPQEVLTEEFLLASYAERYILREMSVKDSVEKMRAIRWRNFDRWESFSEAYYQEQLKRAEKVEEAEEALVMLFPVFSLDLTHSQQLQQLYTDRVMKRLSNAIPESDELACELEKLFARKAYDAYVYLFNNTSDTNKTLEQVKQYTACLSAQNKFAELLAYLHDVEYALDETEWEKLFCRAVSENFRVNALSKQAFAVFNETFSCVNTIKRLEMRSDKHQPYIVNSLIALYFGAQEYEKALYLYSVYYAAARRGFERLYRQLEEWMKLQRITFPKGRFSAFWYCFGHLNAPELPDFFEWAARVPLPASAMGEQSPLAYFFESICRTPYDVKNWEWIHQKLSETRAEQNAWLLVMIEWLLWDKWQRVPEKLWSASVIGRMLGNRDNRVKITHNFGTCVAAYIMRTGDTNIAFLMGDFLRRQGDGARDFFENPWQSKFESIYDKFVKFCVREFGSTGADCYKTLLYELGFDFDLQMIAEETKKAQNRQMLFQAICRNYCTKKRMEETKALLDDKDRWEALSHSDSKMLGILRWLYSDNDSSQYSHPEFYDDINAVIRAKDDCAKILSSYPSKEELFIFDRDCDSLRHKLAVYYQVFSVLYDEDVYDRLPISVALLHENRSMREAYLAFIERVYWIQLEHNRSYDFLYVRFRYLKQYIVRLLRMRFTRLAMCEQECSVHDEDIYDRMERFGHRNEIEKAWYLPQKDDLNAFVALSISEEAKITFLLGLLFSDLTMFFDHYSDEFFCYADEHDAEKLNELLRSLAGRLGYRDMVHGVLKLYRRRMEAGDFDTAQRAAYAVCVYAGDAVQAIAKLRASKRKNIEDKFYALLECVRPQDRLQQIEEDWSLSNDVFWTYESVWCPLYFASNYTFRIFARWRQQILKTKTFSKRYRALLNYLEKKGGKIGDQAIAVGSYLRVLTACKNGNRDQVRKLLAKSEDMAVLIPAQWRDELKHMRSFADGNSKTFHANTADMDSSRGGENEKQDFEFAAWLGEYVCNKSSSLNENQSEEYGKFCELSKRLESTADKRERNDLTSEIGLVALKMTYELHADLRLAIAAELYQKGVQKEKETVKSAIGMLLNSGVTLKSWTKYARALCDYGIETKGQRGREYESLYEEILQPCAKLMEPLYPLDKRLKGLEKLEEDVRQLDLEFELAKALHKAILAEVKTLKEGTRLRIEILNEKRSEDSDGQYLVTDGYVYFQIKNEGTGTTTLNKDGIQVWYSENGGQEIVVELNNILQLRSGFITGDRRKISEPDTGSTEVNIILRIKLGNEIVLCEAKGSFYSTECDAPLCVKGNLYNTSSAVGTSNQDEKLFGRDDLMNNIMEGIPNGVTVIYGPSRIGKTSLLNRVCQNAKEQGNVLVFSYGGEFGNRKENEWVQSFLPDKGEIPYSDSRAMSN